MPNNQIPLLFADGEYLFALPLVRINELQTKTGVGIGALFARVIKGCIQIKNELGEDEVLMVPGEAQFYAVDIIETIRQGLIGGNHGVVNGEEIKVSPTVAERLIQNYVLDRPLKDSWSLAASILGAVIVGYDPPKKDEPAEERASETTMEDVSNTD